MSSKRRLRRSHCVKKRDFATVDEAQAAIRRMHRQGAVTMPMNAYHCRFCKAVHVGHAPGKARG